MRIAWDTGGVQVRRRSRPSPPITAIRTPGVMMPTTNTAARPAQKYHLSVDRHRDGGRKTQQHQPWNTRGDVKVMEGKREDQMVGKVVGVWGNGGRDTIIPICLT